MISFLFWKCDNINLTQTFVRLPKGGKPITPTGDLSQNFVNGAAQTNNHTIENGTAVVDGATRAEVS